MLLFYVEFSSYIITAYISNEFGNFVGPYGSLIIETFIETEHIQNILNLCFMHTHYSVFFGQYNLSHYQFFLCNLICCCNRGQNSLTQR